jgi:HSP20 family protein
MSDDEVEEIEAQETEPAEAEDAAATPAGSWDRLSPLRGRWNRMLEDFVKDMPSLPSMPEIPGFPEWGKGGFPTIDVHEHDGKVVVKAEVPGVGPENLEVDLAGKTLTIAGEKKEERVHDEGDAHQVERIFGSFRRQVVLPVEVDPESVESSYQDGVLTLTLTKASEQPAKKIEIKR